MKAVSKRVNHRTEEEEVEIMSSSPSTVAILSTTSSNAAGGDSTAIIPPIVLPKASKGLWTVIPASAKANRTTNPIRAIVDPIAANIKSGKERGDGKDHISLAVSCLCSQYS